MGNIPGCRRDREPTKSEIKKWPRSMTGNRSDGQNTYQMVEEMAEGEDRRWGHQKRQKRAKKIENAGLKQSKWMARMPK